MACWGIPGTKVPCSGGWNTSSFYSTSRERRAKFSYKIGSGPCRRWKQGNRLPFRLGIELPGFPPSPCTAREGSKRISKLEDHASNNFPNPTQSSLDEGEKQESVDFESFNGTTEVLRSGTSRFVPFSPNLGMPGRGRSLINQAFNGGYEREIIHRDVVRRLNSVGAADKSENFHGISRSEGDSLRSTNLGHGSDDIILLRKGWYGKVAKGHQCNEESTAANSLAVGKRKMPPREHVEQGRWARRSLLNQCIPVILEKLGFNFSCKDLAASQGLNNIYNVNVTISCEMKYQLASEGGPQFLYQSDTGNNFLKYAGKLPFLTTDAVGQGARPMNFLTSSRSNTGSKISDRQEAITQLDYERSQSFLSNPYLKSHMVLPNARRPGGKGRGQKPGRLWLQADGDLNPPQSTIWKDMFTILGLSAFIICGTYAFAVSNRYLKLGSKNKCSSVTTRSHCGSDQSPSTPCSKQPSVVELTNCNFETSVAKKPTFVLFYAPWCSHCQQLEHTWKDLACHLPKKGFDVQLAQVDAEKFGQVAEKYNVIKYPTLVFFKDGKPTEYHTGPRDVDSLVTFIDENYSP